MFKSWLRNVVVVAGFGLALFSGPSRAHADEWGRYYHWPYSSFHQYHWTPYEHQQVYDGQYRYPIQARRYPQIDEWRNWSTTRKPFYRGYHFVLDQF